MNIHVTALEAVMHCGLPGLLYSVKNGLITPRNSFVKSRLADLQQLQPLTTEFFKQFRTGDQNPSLSSYTRFTFLDQMDKIVWPLCYFGPLLFKLGLVGLESLLNYAENASKMPSEGSGLEWEFVARFAVGVVLYCATFQDLSPSESAVVGNLHPKRLKIVFLPDEYHNLQQAKAYVITTATQTSQEAKVLTAYFVCPRYHSFPIFDGLIYLVEYDDQGKPTVVSSRGLQMKQSRGIPAVDPPAEFECGVLLRGDPPQQHKEPH